MSYLSLARMSVVCRSYYIVLFSVERVYLSNELCQHAAEETFERNHRVRSRTSLFV